MLCFHGRACPIHTVFRRGATLLLRSSLSSSAIGLFTVKACSVFSSFNTDFSLGKLSSNVLASFANRCLRSLTVFLSSLLISFCHASQSLKYGSSFLKLLIVSSSSACLSLFIVVPMRILLDTWVLAYVSNRRSRQELNYQ